MNFEITPNGNLKLSLEDGDKDALQYAFDNHGANDDMFLAEILEHTGWQGNGRLFQLSPEDIGALTEAPILTDCKDIADDGTITKVGNVWWFPNYMITSFAQKLMESGSVVFDAAPENERPEPAETARPG